MTIIKKITAFIFIILLVLMDLSLLFKWKEWDLPKANRFMEAKFSLVKIEQIFLFYSLFIALLNLKKIKKITLFSKENLPENLIFLFSAAVMFFYLYFKREIKRWWLVAGGTIFYSFFVFPVIFLFTKRDKQQTKSLPKNK